MSASHDGLLRRVLANTGLLLGGRTVNALVSLGYLGASARALGAQDMGLLVLVNAFALTLGEIVKFQSWQTVLQYGAGPLGEGRVEAFQRVVRFSIVLDLLSALGGAALGVAGAFVLGPYLGFHDAVRPAAAIYALSIVFLASATPIGLLRLFNRFDLYAAQAAVGSTVRFAGSLAGLYFKWDLYAFMAVWAAGTVAAFLYIAAMSIREMGRRDLLQGFAWRGPMAVHMPGVWRFAWATNFSSSLDVAFTHVVTLAVGALLGPQPAALWTIGRQVADAIAKPAKLLAPALYPELAKLRVADGEAAMNKLALQVGVVGGVIATALLGVTVVAGKPILGLVMGKSFEAAAGIMTWQVAAAVIDIWALPLEPMLVSWGRAGDALKVRLAVCLGYLPLMPVLVWQFGLTGAGGSIVIASTALGLGMLGMLRAGSRPAPATTPRSAPF
jgi:O-antigen/teichoic acid export membrane protein